jgi:hypothetical protein
MPNPVMYRGQSITFTAQPTVNGTPGGVFPGPVNWSYTGTGGTFLFSSTTGESITATVTNHTSSGTLTVQAQCGMLMATYAVDLGEPMPNGMQIMAGPVTGTPN